MLFNGDVTQERSTSEYVTGEAGSNLARAAEYFARLTDGTQEPGAIRDRLDASIEASHRALEESLAGFDAFDALAFLRMHATPWALAAAPEGGSVIEASQAAQDVVALALLGMGLPRRALSGGGVGQPNPEVLMSHAAAIVRASQVRALLEGMQAQVPLGRLAGDFLAYELSVRGRQYESIATVINDAVLGGPIAGQSMKALLGFDLETVRTVRSAALRLLNEQFFGARDRVAEIVQSGPPTGDDLAEVAAAFNLMMGESRLYGTVTPAQIAATTGGLSEDSARSILCYFGLTRPAHATDFVSEYSRGSQPVPWGCLGDGDEYLLLNGFLGEDELRRNVERGMIPSSGTSAESRRAWDRYAAHRGRTAEAAASDAFSKLLGGALPFWAGQQFHGPHRVDEAALYTAEAVVASLHGRLYESDMLFVVDGAAFCVEVKAGSVHDKSRSGNVARLASDLQKTLSEGSEQAQRLSSMLKSNGGVWSKDGRWISVGAVTEVHSVVVMLDDMGPLSMSMNQLTSQGVVVSEDVPWIVSLHDLIVTSQVFDHPAQFLQFLRRRRDRRLSTMVDGADELDMLMWFMSGGMYFEADPALVAAQLPTDPPVSEEAVHRFNEQPRVRLGTFTDELDAWFYSKDDDDLATVPKPVRHEEEWVEQFLTATESDKAPGWLRFGADLVGLSGDTQADIGRKLKSQWRRSYEGRREQSLTTHGTTPYGSWLLCAAAAADGVPTEHLSEYIDAKQYQTASSRAMLLLYKPNGSLVATRYRGEPEERTEGRDAEVAGLGLRSLSLTFRPRAQFSKPLPGARPAGRRGRSRR